VAAGIHLAETAEKREYSLHSGSQRGNPRTACSQENHDADIP
jgi:hypothetical protein